MSHPRRGGVVIGVLITLVLLVMVISLVTLLWLERRFETALHSEIERTTQVFQQGDVIGEPFRPDGIRYLHRLYPLIQANTGGLFIRDIWVTKKLSDGSDHLLYPLTMWYTDPDWELRVADWERRSLTSDVGDITGHLLFHIDRTWINRTALAARSIGILMALTVLLVTTRLWGTNVKLEATTDALHERQRELIHLERLALAGQLSANVLHDLKKPVLNIRHGLADLREALEGFNGPTQALSEMEEQTNLFKSILRETNLERFVQARDEEHEYLDLNEVLQQAVGLVRYEQGNVELVWKTFDYPPPIHGSRHQLIQVFSNLILNAYQAMGGHGKLTITSEATTGGMLVRITDTGPGLSPKVKSKLFEPFVTTKPAEQGAGLGLMICKMIVESHSGTIEAGDGEGGGTCFSVTLHVDMSQ